MGGDGDGNVGTLRLLKPTHDTWCMMHEAWSLNHSDWCRNLNRTVSFEAWDQNLLIHMKLALYCEKNIYKVALECHRVRNSDSWAIWVPTLYSFLLLWNRSFGALLSAGRARPHCWWATWNCPFHWEQQVFPSFSWPGVHHWNQNATTTSACHCSSKFWVNAMQDKWQ